MQHLLTELLRIHIAYTLTLTYCFSCFPQSIERMLQMFSFKHCVSCQLDVKKVAVESGNHFSEWSLLNIFSLHHGKDFCLSIDHFSLSRESEEEMCATRLYQI